MRWLRNASKSPSDIVSETDFYLFICNYLLEKITMHFAYYSPAGSVTIDMYVSILC